MKTTTARLPDYVKYGEVHFQIDSQSYKLEVYQSPENHGGRHKNLLKDIEFNGSRGDQDGSGSGTNLKTVVYWQFNIVLKLMVSMKRSASE